MNDQYKARRNPNFASYMPLKFVTLYLVATFSLAIFGPVEYYNFPILKTSLFMTLVVVAIIFGYSHAVKVGFKSAESGFGDMKLVKTLFDWSLAISILSLLFSIISALTSDTLNTDPTMIGQSYLDSYEGVERNTGTYSIVFIAYSLSLPFNFIAFVWGFFYFNRLARHYRLLIVGLTIFSLLFYVLGSGKQKQLGDIVIYLLAVSALKYGIRGKAVSAKHIAFFIILSLVSLVGFIAVLGQRYEALGIDAANINLRILDLMYINTDHPIFFIFGDEVGLNLSLFLTYLSQGYYGLGLAIETESRWTYFLGFSYSLSVLSNRLLGIDWQWPETLVYQTGLQTGWGESKWHTVFTHFATDFTFPGTVLLFGFFAFVYGRSWLSAIRFENPFSILMFSLLTLGAFFMPANNQLLHSPGALFTVLVVAILYLKQGRRFNFSTRARGRKQRSKSFGITQGAF